MTMKQEKRMHEAVVVIGSTSEETGLATLSLDRSRVNDLPDITTHDNSWSLQRRLEVEPTVETALSSTRNETQVVRNVRIRLATRESI